MRDLFFRSKSGRNSMDEITQLLKAWSNGDNEALEKLLPLVDHELRKIARSYMRDERPNHILQTTALVNEALMKLIRESISWDNRRQFYALIAKRMRQVLIDYARRANRAEHIDLDDADAAQERSQTLIILDEALTKLAQTDERMAAIVESRFFIGLTNTEIAELLGISRATVERDWRFACSWLKTEMNADQETRW
jgi:RNA polymerase sigma-70 factor (ECF subfamily)